MMEIKDSSKAFSLLILFTAACIIPFLNVFKKRGSEELADFSGILLYSLIGGIMMVSYSDLIILFLGLEILSIAMYILAGADRKKISSSEASMKYFIIGAFASAILLFGISLYYASSGSFRLDVTVVHSSALLNLSYLLIFCGLAFKIALVPFHFWAPDVYQGTPTIFTATMATIVKISAFGALYQFIRICGANMSEWLYWLLSFVAILSIFLANIMAISQHSVKRLLAYSGIAQAGFILIGLLQFQPDKTWIILYYLVAYTLASLACFFACHFIEVKNGNDDHSAFKGLYYSNPFLAIVLSIALISLSGGPLTAGFMAKLFVLTNAAQIGNIALVVFALILAVISLYYYFRIINLMFTRTNIEHSWQVDMPYKGLLALLSIGTLVAGIAPYLLVNLLK
ncbi:MAG: NADH-quinone oxidoreductase subunit N [Saprospiraceae bacterium]